MDDSSSVRMCNEGKYHNWVQYMSRPECLKKKKIIILGVILQVQMLKFKNDYFIQNTQNARVSNVSEHAKCKYMVRFSISTDNQTVLLVNT